MIDNNHVENEKQDHCPQHSLTSSIRTPRWASCQSCINSSRQPRSRQLLYTSCEIVCACLASGVTTAYTLHHKKRVESSETGYMDTGLRILAFDPGPFSVILDPSPALLLSSCLVLGCAISSFTHRRQNQDRYQTHIFIIAIVSATVAGLATQLDMDLIMLGLVPWTMCSTMLFSLGLHGLARRYNSQQNFIDYRSDEEKILLLD